MRRRAFLSGGSAIVAAATCARRGLARTKPSVTLHGSTTVPFFQYGDGTQIFVAADTGGKRFAFIVDERLPESMLSNALVLAVKPPRMGTAKQCGLTGNGDDDNDVYSLPELRLGGLLLSNAEFVVGPEPRLDSSFLAPDRMHATTGGLLGQDFYRRVVAKIDFNNPTITLVERSAFAAPANGNRLAMVLRKQRYPNVRLSVDGAEGGFDITTADDTFDLSPTFAERTGMAKRHGPPPAAFKTAVIAGGVTVREQLVNYGTSLDPYFGDPEVAGVAGTDFLSRFVLTLDVNGGAIWFEPNR